MRRSSLASCRLERMHARSDVQLGDVLLTHADTWQSVSVAANLAVRGRKSNGHGN
jgi:hypothetical protein